MRYCLWLLLFGYFSSAQTATLLSTTPTSYERIVGFDTFGFTYFIVNNVLHKSDGLANLQYQNLGLGKITSVDLDNPLKIVVFYADFNTVVLLDSQLNEVATRNFSDLPTPIVISAVGNASQNRLWFYDSLSQQIGLYDIYSGVLKFITQPVKGPFLHGQSDLNNFQWIDQRSHWYSVDVYGKITDRGEVPKFDAIILISDEDAIFKKGNSIQFFKSTITQKLIDVDSNSFQSFYYADQILSIFTNHSISNYKITKP